SRALRLLHSAMAANPALREQWNELFPETSAADGIAEAGGIAGSWLAYREGPGRRVMMPVLEAQRNFLNHPERREGDPEQGLLNIGTEVLEIYQALLPDAEAHEVAALHSAAAYLSEQEEIVPGQAMPAALRQGAARLTDY